MKNNENKLSLSAAADERLGEVLADGLKGLDTGGCPGVEAIAALVDGGGALSAEKREKIMKHLASCPACREIFLLGADLREEEKEIKKEKNRITLFKPLALAASLLLVIVSIYLFYKSTEIPKSAEQLVDMEEVTEVPVYSKQEQEPMAGEKKGSKGSGENKLKKARDRKAIPSPPVSAKRKTAQMPRSQTLEAAKARPAALIDTTARDRAERLNLKALSYKTYIPGPELQTLFYESIQLAKQLEDTFKDTEKEPREKDNDVSKINGDEQRFAPVFITAAAGGTGWLSLSPNIDYFLSKSEPGSVAYRFFNLARSGWCDAGGLWYSYSGAVTAGMSMAGKESLGQWQALYPQLDGVFREIAGRTIDRLKQDSR